jgi:rubrerythrin
MPLTTFGSILNFAEEMEAQDVVFYEKAAGNPACAELKELFAEFAADAKKNQKTAQRTRRENVTEMILEPIHGFTRNPYCEACEGAETLSVGEALATARRLEDRAERYYTEAAAKIKALPEVARALKRLGKTRTAHIKKLEAV